MKKLFLLFAFTGIVGAASATTLVSFTKATVVTVAGDDKKGDDKKKKDEKACCKKDANGKGGCADGKGGTKACCKAKADSDAKATTAAPAKTGK